MMPYRKIKPTQLFNGNHFEAENSVLIVQDDGTVEAIVPEHKAGGDIENVEGIISPGFVNAHCHIELSHLKGKIPEHTGLVDFVQQVIKGRGESHEIKLEAMRLAVKELYYSGTVAVGDICNTADSIPVKQNSNLYWHNFVEVSGFVDAAAQNRFDDAKRILDEFRSKVADQSQKSPATIVPHAPYSVSKTLFEKIDAFTKNETISIHNQESRAEDELYKHKKGAFLELYKNLGINIDSFSATGKSSVQSWLPYFTNNQTIISVHNTYINEADIVFAKQFCPKDNLFFCLCPNANLYIENVLPPVANLANLSNNIVIGTDSYASNWQLNMYEEVKTILDNFPSLPKETVLQWATSNGANALGIGDRFGSFTQGTKPGVVHLTGDKAILVA